MKERPAAKIAHDFADGYELLIIFVAIVHI